ncbi:MAG TPA: hypothetical protein VGR56_07150 [Nitrososphaerales archaeon]|nr:hypothetical protein [Nitrososphaerales archaeon]
MDTISLLIVSNLITLAVALISVLAAQSLANDKAFKDAKDGILSEINLDEGISTALLEFIREENMNKPNRGLVPFPRYRTSSFDSFSMGGFASYLDNETKEQLEGVYLQMLIINDAATRHETLTYGVESVMSNVGPIRTSNLALVQTIVETLIRPKLTQLKEKKLGNKRSFLSRWLQV